MPESPPAAPDGSTLEELLALGDRRLYSVYLDLSVGSNGQRTHEVFLRKKEGQLQELAGEDEARRGSVDAVLRSVRAWLAEEFEEANQGAALFVTPEGELIKAVQLPTRTDNLFALHVGAVVAPLARIVEDHDHHCVVVLDATQARILSVYLNAVETEESYRDETIPARTRGGGWSQARFQRHRVEQVQHFHAEVVEHLERFVRRYGSDDIVLLGTEEATAEFQKALPPGLRERVRFVQPAPAEEPAAALLARIEGLLELEHVREDVEILDRLEQRVREDYLAVGGVRATLNDLQAGRVETLVVGSRLGRQGRQCGRCAFVLADGEASCPYCGGELHPIDLYEKMIELAERHDAKVEFVDGDAASELLQRMNGAGAFLKFQ
ncbi:MAG: Vms1/Ankzf1 family peptidyl-tRNA hydrolase [Gemmatimonadota bacterium]